MPIKKGSKVKLEYEGTFDDGSVFDSSKGPDKKPLEFVVGNNQIIPGLEKAITGLQKGEEKTIKIDPKDAYGDHNPELVKQVPRNQVPEGVQAGMFLGVKLPNGQQMIIKVVTVTNETVTIDLNHPLAGKTLNFKIKVLDIITS